MGRKVAVYTFTGRFLAEAVDTGTAIACGMAPLKNGDFMYVMYLSTRAVGVVHKKQTRNLIIKGKQSNE